MAGSIGLVSYKTNADIDAERDAELQAQENARRSLVVEQSIASQIRRDWSAAKDAKREHEERMLDALRRRKGEYSAEKLAQIKESGGADIYMMLTAAKCRGLYSWLRDVLLPSTDEKPYGLSPTPVSEIPKEIEQAIYMQVLQKAEQLAQQGQQVNPLDMLEAAKDEVKDKAYQAAKEAAERHEEVIHDQLSEGGWTEALEQFIDDFSTFPGAILKGPVLRNTLELQWGEGWKPIKGRELKPQVERISPFDLYPSPDATTPDDASYIIERVKFRPADLRNMKGVEGYSDSAIDSVLEHYSVGGLKDWLVNDSERLHLEGKQHTYLNSGTTIDGLEYHGSAMGLTLLQWGVPDVDPLTEYDVEAILIGRDVIRLVINEDALERRPYHVSSFQPIPGSFWGMSIPELMKDIQDVCNATARSLVNNVGMSSGPMSEWNYDRLSPGETADIYPWRVIQTKSSNTTGNNPAVRFYQPDSHAGELFGVYEKFEQRADEVTGVPRYMYGNENVGGAGSTMGGLSMLMESASKNIKAAIGYIDKGVIRRVVEGLWLHNMQYHPDNSIKGDCKIIPRGASAMLMRERTNMMRAEFLQSTANPIDMEIIGIEGRARLLAAVAEGVEIKGFLDDPEEIAERVAQKQKAQGESQQQQQEILQQQAMAKIEEIKAKVAKMNADTASQPLENEKLVAEIKKILADVHGAINATSQARPLQGAQQHQSNAPVRPISGIPQQPDTGNQRLPAQRSGYARGLSLTR